MAALAALIARRFLRDPRFAALIVPLCARLNRAARRFERLMAGLAAGRLPKPRKSGRRGGAHPSGLPTGRGWLIRTLGYEAAGCASQLEALRAESAAAALLALVPAARRILNGLCRQLGIGAFAFRPRPARAAPVAAPVCEPLGEPLCEPLCEPFGEVAFRSQGYTWYVVPTPPANPV